jgi:hypothetical protein
VIGVFDGDWWDAAQIYRSWALHYADWVTEPLQRRYDVPEWATELTVWVNSHWQQNDIFNTTGGDPTVVTNRVSEIVDRFNLNSGKFQTKLLHKKSRKISFFLFVCLVVGWLFVCLFVCLFASFPLAMNSIPRLLLLLLLLPPPQVSQG